VLDDARARFGAGRVARLATVSATGRPHLVPITFALVDDVVWTVVDGKPKSTRALRRLANIAANPRVSVLVDRYADDWSALWWVRADGSALVLDVADPAAARGIRALREKYEPYAAQLPPGPIIRIAVETWRSWAADPERSDGM
jgi:PPOX class probable F420-dependent enzyme